MAINAFEKYSNGDEFGIIDKLNEIEDSIKIKKSSSSGYTLDIHPSYDAETFLNTQYKRAYDLKPENRVRRSMYVDPFVPNFKIMIDFNKPYGLFASESNPNSALAYLKRIFGGEGHRYLMLKSFIEQFQIFLKEYDYLILGVEGLEELYTIYNKHVFVEESEIKCTVNIRETVTMQLMGLINLYNMIWYDNVRCVEVLPENLRRFDLYILVYNAGYFNALLYDICNPLTGKKVINDDLAYQRKLFPTVFKLESLRQLNTFNYANIDFNTYIFQMIDAQIDVLESGKKMFGEISNEMAGDYIKNNLSFSARFITCKGRFSQIDDGVDLSTILAMENASKNKSNKSFFKNWAKRAFTALKKEGVSIVNSSISHVFDTARGLVSKTSPIGNALHLLSTPEEIVKKLGYAVQVPVDGVIKKYVDTPSNWLQSMVESNFRSDVLTDLMHKGTDKLLGTIDGRNQKREIENINEMIKELPANTNIKPNNNLSIPKETKQVGVNKSIEYKDNIPAYNDLSNIDKNDLIELFKK